MKAKKLVMVFMFVLMGLVAGCHYGDDRWSYGDDRYSNRDAFRAGRAYERRQAWRYGPGPYYERYSYYYRR
jgi:ABC-type Fe3+-hydroxamate transport system substrate-binding protein